MIEARVKDSNDLTRFVIDDRMILRIEQDGYGESSLVVRICLKVNLTELLGRVEWVGFEGGIDG